jgi:hypothetical protein
MGVIFDNPISSVQMRLRGGWKTLLINSSVYALVVFAAMGIWAQADAKHLKDVAQGWSVVLMLIQTLLVLVFTSLRISGSVRQDNASGIMESHRLMPITGLSASVGFIVGPSAQMLAIGAVNLVAGIASSSLAGLSSARWLTCNLIMFLFVAFVGTFSVMVGFYRRAVFNSAVVLAVIGLFSRGMLLWALPAMAILVSPLARDSVFSVQSSNELFGPALLFAFVGQAIFGGVFLTAAARKFRQPDRPAFSVSLSLVLLGAWVLLSVVGMIEWDAFEPSFLRWVVGPTNQQTCAQFTGSALSSLLLTLLPLSAAIRTDREHKAAGTRGEPVARRILTTLACSALVCTLLLVPFNELRHLSQSIGIVALSMVAAIVALGALLSLCRPSARHSAWVVIIFLLAAWIAPLIADVVDHSVLMDDYDSQHAPWSITAFGPIGTMTAPWTPDVQTPAGLYCQVAVAVAMAVLALMVELRRRQKTPGPVAETSPPQCALTAPANSAP